jgi:tetratricopeptide (TPR) repeat protein
LNQVWPSDRNDNLDEIIRAYRAALRVYLPQVCPVEYATIQNNLGNAYRIRRRGSVEQNVEESIATYQAALIVCRREVDPYGWARTQNNLGNGYAERRHGDPRDSARLAIASFRAALEVHDVVTYPDDYAMDQTNLGLTRAIPAGTGPGTWIWRWPASCARYSSGPRRPTGAGTAGSSSSQTRSAPGSN